MSKEPTYLTVKENKDCTYSVVRLYFQNQKVGRAIRKPIPYDSGMEYNLQQFLEQANKTKDPEERKKTVLNGVEELLG